MGSRGLAAIDRFLINVYQLALGRPFGVLTKVLVPGTVRRLH
jgi:hypothetical protein